MIKMHPFHSTPLHCIPSIHSIALHCIAFHHHTYSIDAEKPSAEGTSDLDVGSIQIPVKATNEKLPCICI